jgi:hypothetical protein
LSHFHLSQFKAWLPYSRIGLILVATRIPELSLKSSLAAQTLVFKNILGYQSVIPFFSGCLDSRIRRNNETGGGVTAGKKTAEPAMS